ncbi:MAG: O-antigen ligase family protein [Ignavibacteria bacterium]|nr:O-antigen ligase family protein [Ignavibacteria bacterium]
MTTTSKDKAIKYTDSLMLIFLGVAVITSQLSIAASSFGIGGLIILTSFRLVLSRTDLHIDRTLLILFGLFITAQIISSLYSSTPMESLDNIYRKISIYIIFFAAILFIKSEGELKLFIKIFIIFTAIVSSLELSLFAFDIKTILNRPLSEFRLGYFGYAITSGEIKMTVLLLTIPFLLVKKDYIMNKIFLALLSFPILLTYYLTNARNAILGLMAGLIIIGALKNRYFLGGLIAFVVLFLLFAPAPVTERMNSILELNHPSNRNRFIMWDTGMKIIKDHPLLGVGDLDNNRVYRTYKTPEFHGEGSHMHSNVFQILVSFGAVGLMTWLLVMFYIFIKSIKTYFKTRKNGFLSLLVLTSITSMAAMQISGLTEWNFGDAEYAAVFWFTLALGFISHRLNSIAKVNAV